MTDNEKSPFIKFDNHVSVGHIFTVLTIVFSVIWFAAKTEGRINSLEKADALFAKQIEQVRSDTHDDIADIKTLLMRIDDKIDRKADKK